MAGRSTRSASNEGELHSRRRAKGVVQSSHGERSNEGAEPHNQGQAARQLVASGLRKVQKLKHTWRLAICALH
jgi:hypothetical protein